MTIIETTLEKESKDRFLAYALSVVSGRAIPDIRDGLKPVQRRILFAMYHNLKLSPQTGHRKSATVVGEVLGRYHPHGDIACYEAMVRMAQTFSLRYPLVDGEGNFGSLDGDSAAAYRYTEARLTKLAIEVMGEIDQETIPFRMNFDSTTEEPSVLPSRVPNLLINGASGIAVGLATNIPPHNMRDVVKAILELMDDPETGNSKLVSALKGPDFPTACSVLNTKKELDEIYRTGRGNIRMRGDWEVEEGARGKRSIIVSSIPYAVNKSQLVEKIATLIEERKVPQIADIRDESTHLIRVVIDLAPGADPDTAIAYLYKHTTLESNFAVNFTALVPVEGSLNTRPELLSIRQCLQHFIDFRREVVNRKLQFEKRNLLERIHILEGLAIIFDNLDLALQIIRKSDGRQDAAEKLAERFKLTQIQSLAIVDMRVYQLSRTSIGDVRDELKLKATRVAEIDKTLKSAKAIDGIIRKDLEELAEEYGDRRLSKIVKDDIELEFNAEAYVVNEDVFAILTKDGWVKRIRQNNELETTRLREGDSISRAHSLSTIDSVLVLTNFGNMYTIKVSQFPSSSGYGEPVQKFLKFKDGEKIVDSFGVKANQGLGLTDTLTHTLVGGEELVFFTKEGKGAKYKLDWGDGLKKNGKRLMKVRDGDVVTSVCKVAPRYLMVTKRGLGLIIPGAEVPERGAGAMGVVLMGISDDDSGVGIVAVNKGLKEIRLHIDGGGEKIVPIGDFTSGHRALKGKKVITRGSIIAIDGAHV